jgi:predicted TIM-barrel fold metal-dependent hydrolase
VISGDSHLEVLPHRWRDRVPAKYRDALPDALRLSDPAREGNDASRYGEDGQPLPRSSVDALKAGIPYDQWRRTLERLDRTPGAGPPEQRLREQDMDGVDAEILYCPVRRAWDRMKNDDDEAYHAVVSAYNQWLAEEYCAAAPDRLLALGAIPERGVTKAIAELERCARLGLKGVCISAFPNGSLRPAPEDDQFWAEALRIGMPVSIHDEIGQGKDVRDGSAGGADLARRICAYGVKGAVSVSRLVIDGVFERFPALQIYMAENQIGWVPNFLDQMDVLWARHRFWMEREQGLKSLDQPPSVYVKNNFHWGFMDNPYGVKIRHDVGIDRVMWGSDMPHAPSDWPYSVEVIERNFEGVPDDERHQMLAGNAIRYFRLDATFESTEERERQVAERRAGKQAVAAI